jgi:hypothetical protein
VTLIVQLCDGWTVPQLFVWLNSPASAPPRVTLLTINATAPVLVSVTAVGLLVLPTVCAGKVTDAGENFVAGAGTVELSSTPAPLAPNDQVKTNIRAAISVHVRNQDGGREISVYPNGRAEGAVSVAQQHGAALRVVEPLGG